jgi:hypothetical protein
MSKLVEQLEAHVQAQVAGRIWNLQLALQEDGLVLRGYSHTYYAKQLAQHAVMQATDLRVAANDIQVI